jgi:hypothetical protein
MLFDRLSLLISIFSLLVSSVVAWLTLFQRGQLKITRPALIVFIYEQGRPKIFLRTLIYSTGKKGHVVESLYLKVRRGESTQTFSYWAYAETTTMMVGSGLKIADDGVSYNHHFLPPRSGTEFQFLSGAYEIQIYGIVSDSSKPKILGTYQLLLSEQQSEQIKNKNTAAFFEWGPDAQAYHLTIDRHPGSLEKSLRERSTMLMGRDSNDPE